MSWLLVTTFAGGMIAGIALSAYSLTVLQRHAVRLFSESPEGKYDEA